MVEIRQAADGPTGAADHPHPRRHSTAPSPETVVCRVGVPAYRDRPVTRRLGTTRVRGVRPGRWPAACPVPVQRGAGQRRWLLRSRSLSTAASHTPARGGRKVAPATTRTGLCQVRDGTDRRPAARPRVPGQRPRLRSGPDRSPRLRTARPRPGRRVGTRW